MAYKGPDGKFREREVTPTSHPHSPSRYVEPLQPWHVEMNARLFANRVAMLAIVPRGGRIAELGVYEGLFSAALLDLCKPRELHLFDLDTEPIIREVREDSRVTVKRGDSSANLAVYPDDYFDLVYVDGDHSHEGCRRDAQVAKAKVKPGGLLAFNDYTLWSFYEGAEYGVPWAVNQLCHDDAFTVCAFAFMNHGYHDIVLRRPS